MDLKEYNKAVEQEISWLRYYANKDTRELLNTESNLYNDLISIGYTKRVTPLWLRCPCFNLTSNIKIDINIKIEDLETIGEGRNSEMNRYTPLEIEWMKYPEKRLEIIKKLND